MTDDKTLPDIPKPNVPEAAKSQAAVDADQTVHDFFHDLSAETKAADAKQTHRKPKLQQAPNSRALTIVSASAVALFLGLLVAAIAWMAYDFTHLGESTEKKPQHAAPAATNATGEQRAPGMAGAGGGRGRRPPAGMGSGATPPAGRATSPDKK